ncbi:MAG: VOC family protein [Phycisphaerae bacterium]
MTGTNQILGGGGFHHLAMKVKDFDRSVEFYTVVLGFKPTVSWGEGDKRAVMLDAGDGGCVELFAGGPEGPRPDGVIMHMALRTADVDAVTERARVAGATVTVEPRDVDVDSKPAPMAIRLAFFKGPDGEIIELFHLK